MKITINPEILDLIAKKFRDSWSYPIHRHFYSSNSLTPKSYRGLASDILAPLSMHSVKSILDSPVVDVFCLSPSAKSLAYMKNEFILFHSEKTRDAIISAVQNHGHKCIEKILKELNCDVTLLHKEFVGQENFETIMERTLQEFITIHDGAKLSSLYEIDCLREIWSLRDIGYNRADEIAESYAEYPANVERIRQEYTPVSLDEYCEDCGFDPEDAKSIEDYNIYKSSSLSDMKCYLDEMLEEHLEIEKLEPFSRTKILPLGYFDFSICQSNTEGLEFEVVPYEWCCKHKDENGEIIGLVSGSMYYPREECFADWSDMSLAADIFSGQEVSCIEEFMSHCDDDSILENIMEGGVVLVQHMQRNYFSDATKGYGFKNLEFALDCIQSKFEMGMAHVGIFVRPYQHYFDTNRIPLPIEKSRLSALNSISLRAEKFVKQHGENKYPYTIILPRVIG